MARYVTPDLIYYWEGEREYTVVPQRVMFGELVGGKGYSGEQEKDWLALI